MYRFNRTNTDMRSALKQRDEAMALARQAKEINAPAHYVAFAVQAARGAQRSAFQRGRYWGLIGTH